MGGPLLYPPLARTGEDELRQYMRQVVGMSDTYL